MQTRICFAAAIVLVCSLVRVSGEPTFTVTDLGTLGGNTSTANSVAGNGTNAAGMIVGSSTTADNSEHAFLFAEDKMYDLNDLCDLSQTDFKVLTVARTISDSCIIIGDGITKNGDKHAFKLTPESVAGGQWHYQCCQWVWIQNGGGWWWEEGCGCYRWHGPPGNHPPCPPENPPCWWYPLPCPPQCHRPTPTPTPTPTPPGQCWCCLNGRIGLINAAECKEKNGQCYGSREEALQHCREGKPTPPPGQTPTPPRTFIPGVNPTPTLPPAVRVTPTPTRHRRGTTTTTPKTFTAKQQGTQGSATRSATSRKKGRPTPTPSGKP